LISTWSAKKLSNIFGPDLRLFLFFYLVAYFDHLAKQEMQVSVVSHSFIHSFISCVPAHHFNIRLHVLLSVLRLQTNQQRGVMMVVKHVKLDVYHSQLTI